MIKWYSRWLIEALFIRRLCHSKDITYLNFYAEYILAFQRYPNLENSFITTISEDDAIHYIPALHDGTPFFGELTQSDIEEFSITPIQVTVGQTTTVNLSMKRGGTIQGEIINAKTGQNIGANISAYLQTDDWMRLMGKDLQAYAVYGLPQVIIT